MFLKTSAVVFSLFLPLPCTSTFHDSSKKMKKGDGWHKRDLCTEAKIVFNLRFTNYIKYRIAISYMKIHTKTVEHFCFCHGSE